MPERSSVFHAHDNAALADADDVSRDFPYEHGRLLVAHLHLPDGERVLEVAANTGRLSLHLAELVGP